MKRDEAFPSKFWKASDLKGGPETLTIEHVNYEPLKDKIISAGDRHPRCSTTRAWGRGAGGGGQGEDFADKVAFLEAYVHQGGTHCGDAN